mgnify:CR=1 FL=1
MTPSHAWFTELGDLAVPDWVLALADGRAVEPVWRNEDGGVTYRFGAGVAYLKAQRPGVDWQPDAERLRLGPQSQVVEIASNDGYLLQYVKARNIPCVGIEPTASTAAAARERGIETMEQFFGQRFAGEFVASRGKADLAIANNVLAHVPDINDEGTVVGVYTVFFDITQR